MEILIWNWITHYITLVVRLTAERGGWHSAANQIKFKAVLSSALVHGGGNLKDFVDTTNMPSLCMWEKRCEVTRSHILKLVNVI
ncbi:hypothetical protein BVC80_1173g25 [Macleaya cordata]|uniref:Uncharacterized protein n=1 Tax=Macleaya cordata TaxID=56857 RepID=A0A200QID8_MACCD|nr:hypothetical protein BVC80_1173g25 [Macleaya cordata]